MNELNEKNQELGKQIEQYEHRVSDLDSSLKKSIETSDKLEKEKENGVTQFKAEKEQ